MGSKFFNQPCLLYAMEKWIAEILFTHCRTCEYKPNAFWRVFNYFFNSFIQQVLIIFFNIVSGLFNQFKIINPDNFTISKHRQCFTAYQQVFNILFPGFTCVFQQFMCVEAFQGPFMLPTFQ